MFDAIQSIHSNPAPIIITGLTLALCFSTADCTLASALALTLSVSVI